MMLSNTLVSFVAAITLASSVTAAVTPRWGSPPPSQSGQSCSTGSLYCCDSSSNFEDQPTLINSGLLNAFSPDVLANVPIGLNCLASGVAGWYRTIRLLFNSIANTPQL
jgi:hypothetical protein